jgi:hypothetical protein
MEMDITLPKNFVADDAPEVLQRARPVLELPPEAELRVEEVRKTSRGTRINFSYTQPVKLADEALRDVCDVRVDVSSRGALRFNPRGHLVMYKVIPTDPRKVRAISDHLTKLVARGQVYVAKPGEEIDPAQLREQGKTWYVQEDAKGVRQLKRAWIS